MNAQRQFNITGTQKKKSTEKLASGYRINRAADDAAGLAISEKMRRQIRGLDQGARNTQDGISLLQVADGALSEVHDMLHRMTELSVQAANGTNTDSDRLALQNEVDYILDEIDRISEETDFNTMPLFTGEEEDGYSDLVEDASSRTTDTSSNDGNTTNSLTTPNINTWSNAGRLYMPKMSPVLLHGTDNSSVVSNVNYKIEGYDTLINATSVFSFVDGFKENGNISFVTDNEKISLLVDGHEMDSKSWDDIGFSDSVDAGNYSISFKYLKLNFSLASDAEIGDVRNELDSIVTSYHSRMSFGNGSGSGYAVGTNVSLDSNGFRTQFSLSDLKKIYRDDSYDITKSSSRESSATFYFIKDENGNPALQLKSYKIDRNDPFPETGDGNIIFKLTAKSIDKLKNFNWSVDNHNGSTYEDQIIEFAYGNSIIATDVTSNGSGSLEDLYEYLNLNTSSINASKTLIMDSRPGSFIVVDVDYESPVIGTESLIEVDPDPEDPDPEDPDPVDPDPEDPDPVDPDPVDPDPVDPVDPDPEDPVQEDDNDYTRKGKKRFWIQSGAEVGDGMFIDVDIMNTSVLGIVGLNISTEDSAGKAISDIGKAVDRLSSMRSKLGAQQNRLEHTYKNVTNISENTQAAESRIRDTDMAKEMVELSKHNILEQVGTSMIAQANQTNQGVLSLLQ
jgi:flagellin-like hook-associated protein FlgL